MTVRVLITDIDRTAASPCGQLLRYPVYWLTMYRLAE